MVLSLSRPSVKPAPGDLPPGQPRRAQTRWHYLAALFPPPFALAFLIFILAWGLALWRGPVTVRLGTSDRLDTLYLTPGEDGFYNAETRPFTAQFPQANTTYRWSGKNAQFNLPWPLDAVPLKAIVRVSAPRPYLLPDQTGAIMKASGKLEWDDQELGQVAVNGLYQGNYYEFNLPVHLRPNLANFVLSFEVDNTFRPGPGDGRELGVIFFNLRLEPNYPEFGWRGWLASFARPALLALIAFCGWGLARGLLKNKNWALGIEAITGIILLLSLIYWPQAAEPLYASWGFILPIAWLLLTLAEVFRRRTPHLPTPFVYAATLFPLLPLAQFGFGHLDLYSVNPGSVLVAAYIGALFFVGANYINNLTHPEKFEQAFQRAMLGAAIISFAYNHFSVFQLNTNRGVDFRFYYDSFIGFERGGSLYNLKELASIARQAPLAPTFSLVLWPLARVFGSDTGFALFIWRIGSELLLIPCLLILVRVFGGEKQGLKMTPAVWFLALNFGPIAESLGLGQWNVFVLLALSLMARWVQTSQEGKAGLALAGAAGLRLAQLVSGLYFALQSNFRQSWKGLAGTLLGCAGLFGLSGLVVGFSQWDFYLRHLAFAVNPTLVDISNQSLWGFWGRLAIPQVVSNFNGNLPDWVIWVSLASVVALVGMASFVLWQRRSNKDNVDRQLRLGVLVWLAALVPTYVWSHQVAPALVAVLALLLGLSRATDQAPRWQLSLFALAYAVLAYGDRYSFFSSEAVGLARLGASYHFIATLALLTLSLWLLWKSKIPDSSPATSIE